MKLHVLMVNHVSPRGRITKVIGVYSSRVKADDAYRAAVADSLHERAELLPGDFIYSQHVLDGLPVTITEK